MAQQGNEDKPKSTNFTINGDKDGSVNWIGEHTRRATSSEGFKWLKKLKTRIPIVSSSEVDKEFML